MPTIKTLKKNCEALYKKVIIIRDEGTCTWCQKCIGEAVHHIILRNRSALLFYDLLNLVLLCKGCHYKYHNDPQAGDYWFMTTYPARWEYLHFPICDEFGWKRPRRHIVVRSRKKADYELIHETLKEKLRELV